MRPLIRFVPVVVLAVAAGLLPVTGSASSSASSSAAQTAHGTMVSYLVLNRHTGKSALQHKVHQQFRSASLVKILIALDYFESRGPDAVVPEEDRALLQSMLRHSDDTAASILWARGGFEAVVQRMVAKLGLADTEPPEDRRIWGYTATSAADVAKTYRYVLDSAHPRFRDFIMDNLRLAARCAADGHDQYFGIPRAVPRPSAVKQGWSGYGEVPPNEACRQPSTFDATSHRAAGLAAKEGAVHSRTVLTQTEIDLTRPAMHTSGTLGADDAEILVVLSLHPVGTSYNESADRVTNLTRVVYLASRATGLGL